MATFFKCFSYATAGGDVGKFYYLTTGGGIETIDLFFPFFSYNWHPLTTQQLRHKNLFSVCINFWCAYTVPHIYNYSTCKYVFK